MNKTLRLLTSLAAFGAAALFAQAQPAPKIFVVDMAKLYDNHFKTEEQNSKLKDDEQKAQVELEKLNKEGNSLVEQYKELVEQAKNPALSNDAKAKAEADAQGKLEEIQRKQNEVQAFRANTQRSLQQRVKTFRDLMLEEISKIATDIAKKKGATLLIDKSGPSLIGISNFVYVDAGYDITDEVLKEVNKDRPAGSVPAARPAAGPASTTTTPATGETPTVTFPGAKKP
jgi:outer membrane protein